MADTSLEQWARIKQTLTQRELVVLEALCRYCETHADATGGELAAFMGVKETRVRPRLTGLDDKGFVMTGLVRPSRLKDEARCHPYMPMVPLAAVARALREQR